MKQIWKMILETFQNSEKKIKIARALLENGLRIGEDGEIYLKNIKVPYTSIARAINTDRRTVKETVQKIMENPYLYEIYRKIQPAGPFLRETAKALNLRVLTIEVYHDQPGIIAHISNILAEENINILQIIAEYPEIFDNPKLYIIIEGNIKGDIIEKIMSHGAIKSVKID